MDTNPVRILADTDVYQSGEGYERTALIVEWDPINSRRLAKVEIRVDRDPGSSYAGASIWTGLGWIPVLTRNWGTFWHDMPGYTRWKQEAVETKTRNLIVNIGDRLREVVTHSDL